MFDHWLVRLILALFYHCFRVLWNTKEKILNPEEKKGARIYDIAFRFKYDLLAEPNTSTSFCLSFKRTLPLSAILDENVYLYYYDNKEVMLIVVEPGTEIWRARYGSFYKIAQYKYAKQIIKISLEDFYSVCEDIPNPGSKLNFIHFVPRSGSTLLIQMFEETGQCVTVSEPDDFMPMPEQLKAGITHGEKVQHFRAVGKYVARMINNRNDKYKWYFAKVLGWFTLQHYDALSESFPESKHIYLYRDLAPTLKSTLYTFDNLAFFNMLEAIAKYVPNGANNMQKEFIELASSADLSQETIAKLKLLWYNKKPLTFLALCSFCCSYDFFLNKRHLPAIKYNDIVENRQENIKRILEYFELPLHLADMAVRAMNVDSQVNSPISRKQMGTSHNGHLEDGVKMFANDFCKAFDIPGLNEDNRHSNTITLPIS